MKLVAVSWPTKKQPMEDSFWRRWLQRYGGRGRAVGD